MKKRMTAAATVFSSVMFVLGALSTARAQSMPSPTATAMPSATATATATPVPNVTRAQTRARLGQLDALAQRVVRTGDSATAAADERTIVERWPDLRSHLVAYGAARNDLIATDTAVKLLGSANDRKRAANALTAALAPMYPAVGDHVPANVHRLDFLDRALMLDVARSEWTRANSDVISAQSTWGAVRTTVVAKGAEAQAHSYTRALDAVQDGVAAQSRSRSQHAIDQAEIALGTIEKRLDRQIPPWRMFLQKFGM
jgi:hypothetical protein